MSSSSRSNNNDDDGDNADNNRKKKCSSGSDASPNTLLTKKSLAASLSAPRAPPYGSIHRDVLLGGGTKKIGTKSGAVWARHYRVTDHRHERDNQRQQQQRQQQHQATSGIPHDTLRQRLLQRLLSRHHHYDEPHNNNNNNNNYRRLHYNNHPHLPATPEWGDRATRFLGVLVPLEWQHATRDSGSFRSICDGLVTATAPMVPLMAPSAITTFWNNTRCMEPIVYGPHPRNYIHLYRNDQNNNNSSSSTSRPRRLLLFVHGGAWGSGMPWMYRLVAHPRFLTQDWAVAIVGYRTYPDGCLAEQMSDCAAAAAVLQRRFPDTPTTLMGHSSGAHVGLVLLVDHVLERLQQKQQQQQQQPYTTDNIAQNKSLERSFKSVDSFVGLSGPYDISHHFDYEAARGVEELSPMKPVCGYTRENFDKNSPAKRLQAALAQLYYDHHHQQLLHTNTTFGAPSTVALDTIMPPLLLIHGVEDDTVPFTSTAEAARILKSCGVPHCDQVYLADTAHQDTVMHLMLGGKTLDATVAWIQNLEEETHHGDRINPTPPSSSLVPRSKL